MPRRRAPTPHNLGPALGSTSRLALFALPSAKLLLTLSRRGFALVVAPLIVFLTIETHGCPGIFAEAGSAHVACCSVVCCSTTSCRFASLCLRCIEADRPRLCAIQRARATVSESVAWSPAGAPPRTNRAMLLLNALLLDASRRIASRFPGTYSLERCVCCRVAHSGQSLPSFGPSVCPSACASP